MKLNNLMSVNVVKKMFKVGNVFMDGVKTFMDVHRVSKNIGLTSKFWEIEG